MKIAASLLAAALTFIACDHHDGGGSTSGEADAGAYVPPECPAGYGCWGTPQACMVTADCCINTSGGTCASVCHDATVCVYTQVQGAICDTDEECSQPAACLPCTSTKSASMPYGVSCVDDWHVAEGTPVCYPTWR